MPWNLLWCTTSTEGDNYIIARPLSIMIEKSWWLGLNLFLRSRRKKKSFHSFKKSKKEEPENYMLANLTAIPGKVVEQLVFETISKYHQFP